MYYVDETVKNLKAEVARGAKLKCSKCGLKGAALGCYVKSCRRTYHAPCAMGISTARWDHVVFLSLVRDILFCFCSCFFFFCFVLFCIDFFSSVY